MTWQKSPPELVATFERVIPVAPGIVAKPMFGYPACFLNGHMLMGLHQNDMILRLSEPDRAAALALEGCHTFEPMPGRPMTEYVALSPQLITNKNELRIWVAKAVAYVATFEKKAPKSKAAPAPKSAKRR